MKNNNMTFNPYARPRRSTRLPKFDYTQNGAYFITICTHKKQNLFGEIVDGEVRLDECGQIVVSEWLKTEEIRREIILDEYIVMPNHFHGIIMIQRNCRGTLQRAPTFEQFGQPTSDSIPSIIRGFKSTITRQINEIRRTPHMPIWQSNYYEHVIRDETELDSIREYIQFNPQKWFEDDENPCEV
jgi:putative transposase